MYNEVALVIYMVQAMKERMSNLAQSLGMPEGLSENMK